MYSSDKRKHKTLTLSAKAEVIKELQKVDKCINLVKEYGVGCSMIYDIRENTEIKINFFRLFPVIRRFR
jgi:uncharacterized protein YtpQ (UPF0354 family)